MKVVCGVAAAREALSVGRRLDLASVPDSFLDTTERVFGERLSPLDTVSRIIEDVQDKGDHAVRALNLALDGADNADLEVKDTVLDAAADCVDSRVLEAFVHAAERVRRFHEASKPRD